MAVVTTSALFLCSQHFYWGRPDVSKIQGLIGSPESLGSKLNVYKRELKKQNIKKPNAVGIF